MLPKARGLCVPGKCARIQPIGDRTIAVCGREQAPVEKLALRFKQTVIDRLLDQSMAKAIRDTAMSTHAGQKSGLAERFGGMQERFPARVRQQCAKQRNGETITCHRPGACHVSGRT